MFTWFDYWNRWNGID